MSVCTESHQRDRRECLHWVTSNRSAWVSALSCVKEVGMCVCTELHQRGRRECLHWVTPKRSAWVSALSYTKEVGMSVCTELSQRGRLRWKLIGSTSFLRHRASKTTTWPEYQTTRHKGHPPSSRPRAQELCESPGGHSWAPVPNKPTVSVDVKQPSTNRNRAGLSDRRVVNPGGNAGKSSTRNYGWCPAL